LYNNNNNINSNSNCMLMETSPMAQRQYFQDSAASAMTVPEIVDRFNEQIELNEMALAQEAEEKNKRRERYLQSRRRRQAMLAKKKKKKKEQQGNNNSNNNNKVSNHYSLKASPKSGKGVLMNATPSFSVDPRTYQAPKNLPQPTEPETQLLLQALADNVLLKEKRSSRRHHDDDDDPNHQHHDQIITTTTQELKDALVKAFETVLIKKGQTVEEAVAASGGSQHLDDANCLYVIESGQIDLNDQETGKRVATATAG
jgi:hypothetical protein